MYVCAVFVLMFVSLMFYSHYHYDSNHYVVVVVVVVVGGDDVDVEVDGVDNSVYNNC